ncbi:MAG: hypothetical protein NT103_00230 [Campylobacterales bacterium]|nr:hypothetical protein [Campylobacterales bacterium]
MRILLLNDNPVVRKLVALSAQKTKDDLNVVWSVDEIEHDEYDLLIVDDAYYSDEIMTALGERIIYKTSLLMATRGNDVPAGFDKVINKPFLPTDLVELFANIEKSLQTAVKPEKEKSIDLLSIESDDELFGLDDELDFNDEKEEDLVNSAALDSFDDELLQGMKTNVLDHEEVQELQDLLEDTDTFNEDEEFSIENLDLDEEETEIIIPSSIEKLEDLEDLDEDEFDDIFNGLGLDENEEALKVEDEELDNALLDDLMMGEMDVLESEEELESLEDLPRIEEDESSREPISDLLSDDEFDDLEQQIQDAVGELDLEDLESTLNDTNLDEFGLDDLGSFDEIDDLDGIDEREMKLAIGESVEEELSVRVGTGEHSSLDAEALSEAMGKPSKDLEINDKSEAPVLASATEKKSSPSEGMEALQALLKALSNDDVAASLKGLNISININFGDEK